MSAVLLLGYNRPENLSQRIHEISQNKPNHLYISVDKCEDHVIHEEMRRTVQAGVDSYFNPGCVTVYWQDRRLGLASHIKWALDKVFETEKEIIVIEDDIKISSNFVRVMSESFSAFRKNRNFGTVGGFSGVPFSRSWNWNYWRKTNVFSAWGWMIGAGTWSKFQLEIPQGDLRSDLSNSKSWGLLTRTQKVIWLKRFEKVRANPNLTWDYQMQYMTFKLDLFHILPLFRICENLGFGDARSTNTKNPRPKWMQSEILSESYFTNELPAPIAFAISRHIDAFTISGDSQIRKSINVLRKLNK